TSQGAQMAKFVGYFTLLACLYAATVEAQEPQPVPEMKSLESALAGRWSITEKFEPDEWTPNGGTGYGEEGGRRGPGRCTVMEEIHDHTPFEEGYGVGSRWTPDGKKLMYMGIDRTLMEATVTPHGGSVEIGAAQPFAKTNTLTLRFGGTYDIAPNGRVLVNS